MDANAKNVSEVRQILMGILAESFANCLVVFFPIQRLPTFSGIKLPCFYTKGQCLVVATLECLHLSRSIQGPLTATDLVRHPPVGKIIAEWPKKNPDKVRSHSSKGFLF